MHKLTATEVEEADTIVKPGDTDVQKSRIYINEIQKAQWDGQPVLWVKGAYSDGCTKLLSADHTITSDTILTLTLKGWRPTDQICTQALVSFTYIYKDISADSLQKLTQYVIDGEQHQFQP